MSRKSEITLLLGLIAAACVVQAVVVHRATVPALDAVRYVRAARLLGDAGLQEFLRSEPDSPLFAVWLSAVHAVLVFLAGEFRQSWAISSQVASAVPLVLLPLPVYGLSRRIAGPTSAMLGTALLISLPELIRLGGDGIGDTSHLFWLSLAMWLLIAHLSRRGESNDNLALMATAGVATGLAVLVRVEATVLGVAFLLVSAIAWLRPESVGSRPTWRAPLAYGLGVAAILGAYAGLHLRAEVTERAAAEQASASAGELAAAFEAPRWSDDLCFSAKDATVSIRRRGWAAASAQLAEQLPKAFGYLPGLLAIAGFWSMRGRGASDADRLLQIFSFLLLGGIFFHTVREGYLSARHLLPLGIAATACMGRGAEATAAILSAGLRRTDLRRKCTASGGLLERLCCERPVAVTLVACVVAFCLLRGTRPVHRSRLGHRLAAEWLGENAAVGQRVVDTRGWTGLYSGLATTPYESARAELGRPSLGYVVVEDWELERDSSRGRSLNLLLRSAGGRVATFPHAGEGRSATRVSIYRWDADKLWNAASREEDLARR